MQNLKILKALNRLSIYDLNRFKKFVHSPYFNQSENITCLFDFYYAGIKKKEIDKYGKEDIWKRTFSDLPYKDSRFRKYNTDLLSLLEEFLSIEQFKAQPLQESTNLLEAVIDNKMPELYNSVLKTTERLSARHLERNANYYFYQYMAEKHRFNLTSEFEKKSASKTKIQFYNIQDINDNLDYFFVAEKLRYYCSMLSWKNVVKHDVELLFIDDIVELVKDKKYYNIPTIGIYYQIYLTTIEPENPEHYFTLKELIQKNLNLFPQQEAKHIFDAALNYCVRKVNKGDKHFNKELLNIYNQGLEQEVLLINGEITPTSFRNICIIGLRLGDIKWVEDFIKEYSIKINQKYRDNAIKFNKARVSLFKKDYDGLVDLLNEVEFDDLVYTLDSKLMLIIAFYELDNKDLAMSSINAFKVFLVRHKNIPDQYKLIFGNFNSYVEKIIKLEFSEVKLKKLQADLTSEKSVASKNWFKRKNTRITVKEEKVIRSIEDFDAMSMSSELQVGCTFQNIDLTKKKVDWSKFKLCSTTFLGCKLKEADEVLLIKEGALILPDYNEHPYNPYRNKLYSWQELEKMGSNEKTVDLNIYEHFYETRFSAGINDSLWQRIHDHAIDTGIKQLIEPLANGDFGKKIVGFMGGHGTLRTDPFYRKTAYTAKAIAEHGYFVASGGGPGIMEATNLGAYFAGKSSKDLQGAIEHISKAPHFEDTGFMDVAKEVLAQFPDGSESLAIPTWFYGHEPSNVFASHIAKYFSNSIREDTLLAICLHGIIYAPGSAGTTQEIFMDAAQNHYGTFGYLSPMVFLGKERYEIDTMLYPMLKQLAKGREYRDLLFLTDDPEEAVEFIERNPPRKVD